VKETCFSKEINPIVGSISCWDPSIYSWVIIRYERRVMGYYSYEHA